MISVILKILEIDKMYGVSKNIDIAKGSNKLALTWREAQEQRKRNKAWQ